MGAIVSQITSLAIVYSAFYSGVDQRKHQSFASLAFVWGIHRDRWIPRTKGQLRGKCFHLMTSSCLQNPRTPLYPSGSARTTVTQWTITVEPTLNKTCPNTFITLTINVLKMSLFWRRVNDSWPQSKCMMSIWCYTITPLIRDCFATCKTQTFRVSVTACEVFIINCSHRWWPYPYDTRIKCKSDFFKAEGI